MTSPHHGQRRVRVSEEGSYNRLIFPALLLSLNPWRSIESRFVKEECVSGSMPDVADGDDPRNAY
jgi:hypothetical protein